VSISRHYSFDEPSAMTKETIFNQSVVHASAQVVGGTLFAVTSAGYLHGAVFPLDV
jgi:hypothetical protein